MKATGDILVPQGTNQQARRFTHTQAKLQSGCITFWQSVAQTNVGASGYVISA
jgi:hypothetical protein